MSEGFHDGFVDATLNSPNHVDIDSVLSRSHGDDSWTHSEYWEGMGFHDEHLAGRPRHNAPRIPAEPSQQQRIEPHTLQAYPVDVAQVSAGTAPFVPSSTRCYFYGLAVSSSGVQVEVVDNLTGRIIFRQSADGSAFLPSPIKCENGFAFAVFSTPSQHVGSSVQATGGNGSVVAYFAESPV